MLVDAKLFLRSSFHFQRKMLNVLLLNLPYIIIGLILNCIQCINKNKQKINRSKD